MGLSNEQRDDRMVYRWLEAQDKNILIHSLVKGDKVIICEGGKIKPYIFKHQNLSFAPYSFTTMKGKKKWYNDIVKVRDIRLNSIHVQLKESKYYK